MAARPYEISLWTYNDKFLSVLTSSDAPKLGAAYEPHWYDGLNGEKKLTFTIPIKYYDTETNKMVNNDLWYNDLKKSHSLANEKKVKLIFDKFAKSGGTYTHEIHEFVIENITEERSDTELLCRVECVGAAFKELGKTGTEITLNFDTVLLEEEKNNTTIHPTANYWLNKVFPAKTSDDTNVHWEYQIDMNNIMAMPRTKIYETDFVTNWHQAGEVLEPTYAIAPIEKERFIDVKNSNRYNITQDIAETFQVFVEYRYIYGDKDQPFKPTRKLVWFYDSVIENSEYSIAYGNNETGFSRTSNSVDVTTKMFVEPIESEYSDDGMVSIAKAKNNKTRDNFILDFSYFIESGQMSSTQINRIPRFEAEIRAKNEELEVVAEELAALAYQISMLKADVSNLENKYQSANDNVIDIENTLLGFDAALTTSLVWDKDVLNSAKGEGTYTSSTLRRRGVHQTDLVVKLRSGATTTIITPNSYIYDNYGYVTGLRFLASVAPNDSILLLTYKYDLLAFYRNERSTYTAIRDSVKAQLDEKKAELTRAETLETTKKTALETVSNEKQTLITDFNILMGPFLKEGTWNESTYKPSFKAESSTQIPLTFDPITLVGEPKASYMESLTEKFYHYITPPAGIDPTQIEKVVIMHSFTEGGMPVTQELRYNAQWIPQYIYKKKVHQTQIYETLAAFNSNTPPRNVAYAYYVKENANTYYNPGSGWVPMAHELVFVLDKDVKVNIAGETFKINTNASAGNVEIPIPAGNLVSTGEYTIIQRRWLLTGNGLPNGEPLRNFQTTSLVLKRSGVELLEFDDYNVTHNGSIKSITLKINNKVVHNATVYTADYKLDVSAEQLYRDALEVSKTSAYPEVSYDISFVYINQALNPEIVEDANYNRVLHLGNIVRITDYDMQVKGLKGIVTSVDVNLDRPEETSFTVENYKTRFEDLFARIVASSEQMKSSGYLYDRAAAAFSGPGGGMSASILQQTLDEAAFTMSSGLANGVSWGAHGILTETKDPYPNGVKGQTWITGGNILLSNNVDQAGNRIWTTALSPLGISANVIQTGRLDTGLVNIYSGDQIRFSWKADGLFAYKADPNSGLTQYDTYVKYNEDGLLFLDHGSRAVELGWDGLYIGSQSGSVELTGANGLEIYNNALPRQLLIKLGGFGTQDVSGVYEDYGMKFYKTINGQHIETLVSTNNGELWLRDTLMVGAAGSDNFVGITGSGLASGESDPIRIWAGDNVPQQAPFYVTHKGNINATNANISGLINAMGGMIGNWLINNSSIPGALTDSSNTVGLSPTGITFWSGGLRPPQLYYETQPYQPGALIEYNNVIYRNIAASLGIPPTDTAYWEIETGSLATFSVDSGGHLYASNADIIGNIVATSGSFTGSITAQSGEIGGWVIASNMLRNTAGIVGMASEIEGISFWAGGPRTDQAPFYVTADGFLAAKNAEISGAIYADRGYFSGTMQIGAGTFWDDGVWYLIGDTVNYNGYVYEAIQQNSNVLPTDIAYWKRVDPYSYISGNSASYFSLKIGDYFTVRPDGTLSATNGSFSGSVTAQTGYIGGWIIGENDLRNTTGTVGLDSLGDNTIWAGSIDAPIFYLTKTGYLFAKEAEIEGKITVTEGHILGRLGVGEDPTYSYISVVGTDPLAMKIGDYFYVTHDGTMTAQNATIVGKITANEGYIGGLNGWIISDSLLESLDHSVGLYAGNTNYLVTENLQSIPARIWAGGFDTETPTDTPFLVTNSGKLYASNANVRGEIIAESGWIANTFRLGEIDKGIIMHVTRDEATKNYQSSFIGSPQFASGALGYGWVIRDDGSATFQNISVRGTIRSSVFEYDRISAVGGSLYIAPTIVCLQYSEPIIEEVVEQVPTGYLLITVPNDVPSTTIAGREWVVGDNIIYEFSVTLPDGFKEFTNKRASIVAIDTTNITLRMEKMEVLSDAEALIGKPVNPQSSIIFYGSEDNKQAVYLTALSEEGGPFIDIVDNALDVPDEENPMPKVRLGRLDGVTDSSFPDISLKGYGLYSQNAYLRGQLMLPGAGITNQIAVKYSYSQGLERAEVNVQNLTPEELNSAIRMWAGIPLGATSIDQARFIVTESGFVYANAGVFSGIINAVDGEFSGIIKAAGVVIDNARTSALESTHQQFYIAYKKNPTSPNDYVLNINSKGLSIWEGGLRAYSDWETGWRDADTTAPSQASTLPYGYNASTNPDPFPYLALMDKASPRLSVRYMNMIEIIRVTAQHHKYYSIKNNLGKLFFTYGADIQSLDPNYDSLENSAYTQTTNNFIGVATENNNLFLISSGSSGLALNGDGPAPVFINVPVNEIGVNGTPSDPLTVKGSIQVYDNSTGGKGVVSLGGAQIQQAISGSETIGINIVI